MLVGASLLMLIRLLNGATVSIKVANVLEWSFTEAARVAHKSPFSPSILLSLFWRDKALGMECDLVFEDFEIGCMGFLFLVSPDDLGLGHYCCCSGSES